MGQLPTAHRSPWSVAVHGKTTATWTRESFADAHTDGEQFHSAAIEGGHPLLVTVRDRGGRLVASWRTDNYVPLEVLPGVSA